MSFSFFVILLAQFFSALGDNALMFAAIALLKEYHAPDWQIPVLQQCFVLAFIFLAPFVGVLSDALPKGSVMLLSNTVKIFGCSAMLLGVQPLLAYGLVGIGAALYSPAKYGILTEFLPKNRLVWANSWMEGLTVAAIILGAILGGFLVSLEPEEMSMVLWLGSRIDAVSSSSFAILAILLAYFLAALFNLFIPKLPIERTFSSHHVSRLVLDFTISLLRLWKDPLGQVSLAVTSLFWGVSTTLRLIILVWAALNLGMDLEEATRLTALVAVGLALGSILAAKQVPLERAEKVLPLGILMGLLVITMIWVETAWVARCLLVLVGALAGIFIIPMNALLQYRGHQLMGSGHSIAVQNFNENISILVMLGVYALMLRANLTSNTIIFVFGLLIALAMLWISKNHRNDPV